MWSIYKFYKKKDHLSVAIVVGEYINTMWTTLVFNSDLYQVIKQYGNTKKNRSQNKLSIIKAFL